MVVSNFMSCLGESILINSSTNRFEFLIGQYFLSVFMKEKEVTDITIDPYRETADINASNNNWPVEEEIEAPDRFQIYKSNKVKEKLNPMQKAMGKTKVDKTE